MGRMKLEQLRSIGEIHARRHRIDLDLWRRLHIDAWVDLDFDRPGRFAIFGKQGDLVAGLDLVNRSIVRRAVRLGAADHPDIGRWRVDPLGVLWKLELLGEPVAQIRPPARRRHQECPGLGARRAPARRREDIGPHVEHRQQVVASIGIRCRDDDRLLGHVEPGDGIQRIEVGAHDAFEICRRVFGHVDERVHRPLEILAGAVGKLLAGHVHRHDGVEVNVGVDRDGVRLLFGDRRCRLGQRRGCCRRTKAERQCQWQDSSKHVEPPLLNC